MSIESVFTLFFSGQGRNMRFPSLSRAGPARQFFSAWIGAGMRPPRATNTDGENALTGRMGA